MKLPKTLRCLAKGIHSRDARLACNADIPPDSYRFLRRIARDYAPRTILDVGANVGEFARWCAVCIPDADIHAFEPLPGCRSALETLQRSHPQVQLHRMAVGDTSGSVEMHENAYTPSSSLLAMHERHRELWPKTAETREVTVPLGTLDAVDDEQGFAGPVFLKSDVQGYELQVLRGAGKVLEKTDVIMLEVLFEPLYEGQSDFYTLVTFLGERGFHFVDFADERRMGPDRRLVYADAVFARRPA